MNGGNAPSWNAARPATATPPSDLGGKTVMLADDGLATGAEHAGRGRGRARSRRGRVVARCPGGLPDGPGIAGARLTEAVFSLHTPGKFHAVGSYYRRV